MSLDQLVYPIYINLFFWSNILIVVDKNIENHEHHQSNIDDDNINNKEVNDL